MNSDIICIHQPEHLPWLGYIYKIINSDKFVILDDVQYKKGHYSNRNRVRINSELGYSWITVPVSNKGVLKKKMNEVEIDYSKKWQKKYLDTLYYNYKKTPFFELYYFAIEKIIKNDFKYIADLNIEIIKFFIHCFKIKTELILSSTLNVTGLKDEKLLSILEKLQSRNYFIGSNGEHDFEFFNKRGINTIEQSFKHPHYKQYHGEFISNLSAIDLLFNYGEESLKILKGT